MDRRIAAIEPIERRTVWLAVRDGTFSIAYLKAATDRLGAPIARVEAALSGSSWLAGPAFSIADIDAYPMLRVLPDLAPAVVNAQSTPRICEYIGRIAARDSVREALKAARTEHPERQFVPGLEAFPLGLNLALGRQRLQPRLDEFRGVPAARQQPQSDRGDERARPHGDGDELEAETSAE